MKKIFAIALVGLFAVAFTDNANANAFDTNNDVVFTVGDYDAPVNVIAFEIVPVATEFAENVAVLTVNSANVGGFLTSVPIDAGDSVINSKTLTFENSETFADVPIDYGLCYVNEFELNKPIPNLTEYVKTYNETFGSTAPDLVKAIATNVGKLTTWNI